MLNYIPRDGGMNLFFVDGKENTCAVYECTCNNFIKREMNRKYIAGANHYNITSLPLNHEHDFSGSYKRQKAAEYILGNMGDTDFGVKDLISVLSDASIEQDNGLYGTVYANIACPATDELYYACDGFPAASGSRWQRIPQAGEWFGELDERTEL